MITKSLLSRLYEAIDVSRIEGTTVATATDSYGNIKKSSTEWWNAIILCRMNVREALLPAIVLLLDELITVHRLNTKHPDHARIAVLVESRQFLLDFIEDPARFGATPPTPHTEPHNENPN